MSENKGVQTVKQELVHNDVVPKSMQHLLSKTIRGTNLIIFETFVITNW